MNDKQLDKKVRQDAARLKKDINTLVGDSVMQLSRMEGNLSHTSGKAKEEFTTWIEKGISTVSKRLKKLSGGAKGNIGDTASTVKKDFGHAATSIKKDISHQLRQYNDIAQEAAKKAPNGLAKKAVRYPWVAITAGLLVGFVLGNLLKPVRPLVG